MKISTRTNEKTVKKNSMRGGTKNAQFEVMPVGEIGGSSDAATSVVNARLAQLGAAQIENSKFDGNLGNNFHLGETIGVGGGGARKRRVKTKKSKKSNKSTKSRKSKKSKKSKKSTHRKR